MNEVINKVNNVLRGPSFEQDFTFIRNSAIVRVMLWHAGLDLTNEGIINALDALENIERKPFDS